VVEMLVISWNLNSVASKLTMEELAEVDLEPIARSNTAIEAELTLAAA